MAEHIIPVPPTGVFQWLLRREFDTAFYRLRFRWNERVQSWYMDVANGANIRQVYGIKLNTGTDKLRAFKARDVPRGTLNVVDSTGTGTQPTLENFGKTVLLKYVDAPEVTTTVIAREQPATLPAPIPPGDLPLHAESHESLGPDKLDITALDVGATPALGSVLTYAGGNTASWQLPTVPAHEGQHRLTGSDSIILETLKTGEADTAKVINPDGASGLSWNAIPQQMADLPTITLFDHASKISTTVLQTIPYVSVKETPDPAFFSQATADRITVETAGRYYIAGHAFFGPSSPGASDTTLIFMKVFKNGSGASATDGLRGSCSMREDSIAFNHIAVSGEIRLVQGDIIDFRFEHDNGSDVVGVLQPDSSSLTMIFLGP